MGIVEEPLLDMEDLAAASDLCAETLRSIQTLGLDSDAWDGFKMRAELEAAVEKTVVEVCQLSSNSRDASVASRIRSTAQDLFDKVLAGDAAGLGQIAGVSERKLSRETFHSLVDEWRKGNCRDVCQIIAGVAGDSVTCLACRGEGCGLCRPSAGAASGMRW
jgi:23S rRNA pseudoU1915 N3-methylase RlmH